MVPQMPVLFLIGECNRPFDIRILQRVQVLQDSFGVLSTHPCVGQQADAVRAGRAGLLAGVSTIRWTRRRSPNRTQENSDGIAPF